MLGIRVDAGGFLKGAIMAQCYGKILRFKAMALWCWSKGSGSADILRTSEAKL